MEADSVSKCREYYVNLKQREVSNITFPNEQTLVTNHKSNNNSTVLNYVV